MQGGSKTTQEDQVKQSEFRGARYLGSWRVRGLIAAALLALVPAALFASHQYNDVPDSNFFHGDIDAITRAGLTSGCGAPNPGGFCPDSNITRQAEAAFLHRGLSRVALSSGFLGDGDILPSDDFPFDTQVGMVEIEVGGTTAKDPAAHQYVKVDAVVNVAAIAGTLPFPVQFYLAEEVGVDTVAATSSLMIAAIDNGPSIPASVTVSWVFSAAPGEHTYSLYAYTIEDPVDSDLPTALMQSLTMTATTHTFGTLPVGILNAKPLPR
jgi:hypothetical protein